MAISLQAPEIRELKPHITVFGVGGAGGNAVNNMIESGLQGVDFVVANTDAQALTSSKAQRLIQMGIAVTEGLGAGSQPDIGRAAAEEVIDEIRDQLSGAHMAFITAGMGGGTGTGAAPVIAQAAREMGILTVGVVTKPFQFEGSRRMRLAESGIQELQQSVDTLIVIPNQNLFRVANEKTTFADAFAMADQVLYSGVACITDLMVKEGLINLDFADVRAIMRGMGKAMMGTGEASGDDRAMTAAAAAIANPLLDDVSMRGARGLLISITGGPDLTLYEVDEAATRIREEVDSEANIILGATFDEGLEGVIRVSVVATGIDHEVGVDAGEVTATEQRIAEVAERLRAEARARAAQAAAQRSLVQGNKSAEASPVAPAQPAPAAQPVGEAPAARAPAEPADDSAKPEAAAPTPRPDPSEAVAQALAEPAAQPRGEANPPQQEQVRAQQPAPQAPVARFAPVAEQAPAAQAAAQPAPQPAAPQMPPVAANAPVSGASSEMPHSAGQQGHDAPFMPPQPEQVLRAPRMPRVDELPVPAQNQIRAHHEAEGKRPSLLQRLATVGFGRREENQQPVHGHDHGNEYGHDHGYQPEPAPRHEHSAHAGAMPAAAPSAQAQATRQAAAQPQPQPQSQAPVQRPAAPGMSPAHAEFAKRPAAPQGYRPAQGQLDAHGRGQAPARSLDDDQLEIPAFLRRQAQ
ncbi:MAG: cell division protein FtsZ [Saliniramus fredricksonii]|uniref:Cell division protein FtsZ n=1 Tax=Saliniramus fredricksonii TaxID=1653334 RepID=A0A0N8KEA7_9HYPH|nr:cell division protein FtsZ [Saliniramus fredricksonii]KPQ10810.1 MAG: cell division protein FtsZ [Saliniramus fredricksonii]SCC81036.1 cell division protein FtsZ [Saliniramus fredricksonii]